MFPVSLGDPLHDGIEHDVQAFSRRNPDVKPARYPPDGPFPSDRRPFLLLRELLVHQHLGADNAVARQLVDLGVG